MLALSGRMQLHDDEKQATKNQIPNTKYQKPNTNIATSAQASPAIAFLLATLVALHFTPVSESLGRSFELA